MGQLSTAYPEVFLREPLFQAHARVLGRQEAEDEPEDGYQGRDEQVAEGGALALQHPDRDPADLRQLPHDPRPDRPS